jgi:hypothetical protein
MNGSGQQNQIALLGVYTAVGIRKPEKTAFPSKHLDTARPEAVPLRAKKQ